MIYDIILKSFEILRIYDSKIIIIIAIEWCDRHYQEHMGKQTQMGEPCGEETWQQMDNQSHRMDTPWT